ncbi:MAG: RNA-splicing ligase RtcB [Euryarchaeota archaeon RBG_19FT_COMBO_56_21]|nr:MAG: RNA-splicing ligase RtcB [Euryarchaeota archaeon RBG_19FT_COMBO_56_21]
MNKLDEFRFEIPRSFKPCMSTSAVIFADDKMIRSVKADNAPEQAANVACLPGIVGKSLAMPDIHWGYGFPIGGVAAFDAEKGVISPGGIGYDVNCGVKLVRTDLMVNDVAKDVRKIVDTIFENVPSGVGEKGKVRLTVKEIDDVLDGGAEWAVAQGYGWEDDLASSEENGRMRTADSDKVDQKAKQRGAPQLGTLGGGNHFLELQRVEKIFDTEAAKVFGIDSVDQVMVSIHSGSRGCGHQIASDYIRIMEGAIRKYNIQVPDRQLACAPVNSEEGQNCFKAMSAAANYAWANRQLILHWVRESFEKALSRSAEDMGMRCVYDVAHNICKLEEHTVAGKRMKLYVHRKGATRAFDSSRSEVPQKYRHVGQPVLIPGDMGSASYVLVGTPGAMAETYGSTCHGAGRLMSRTSATRKFSANEVVSLLNSRGIYIRAASKDGIVEEAPGAYKDVDDVVRIAHGAGISRMVARLKPIGVMKG